MDLIANEFVHKQMSNIGNNCFEQKLQNVILLEKSNKFGEEGNTAITSAKKEKERKKKRKPRPYQLSRNYIANCDLVQQNSLTHFKLDFLLLICRLVLVL